MSVETIGLTWIGVGNAFAKKYFNTSAILSSSNTPYKLLIDCGTTATSALHSMGVTIGEIDGIFISHIHADHIGGLEEVAYQAKFVYGKKLDLFIAEDLIETLWENSLKGGLDYLGDGTPQVMSDYFNIMPMEVGKVISINGVYNISIFPTVHIKNKSSYGLNINDIYVLSCDARFDRDMIDTAIAAGVKIIFHDCAIGLPGVHATLEELLTLPDEIQEHIKLVHYGDNYHDQIASGRMRFVQQRAYFSNSKTS